MQNRNKLKGLSNIGSKKLIVRPNTIIDEFPLFINLSNPNERKEINIEKFINPNL